MSSDQSNHCSFLPDEDHIRKIRLLVRIIISNEQENAKIL